MKIWELLGSGKNKNADKQAGIEADADIRMGMNTEFDTKIDKSFSGNEGTDLVRKRLTFQGNVQFVGFRYRAKCFADELGLTGHVENLDNGNVLMEVQGPEVKIRKLIRCLKESRPIRIDAIQEENLPVKRESGFQYYY